MVGAAVSATKQASGILNGANYHNSGYSTNIKTALLFSQRWFFILGSIIILFIAWFFTGLPLLFPKLILGSFTAITIADLFFLFATGKAPQARRIMPERFGNGDWTTIFIDITNGFHFQVNVSVIDELPVQFQLRNQRFEAKLKAGGTTTIQYKLRPVERGEYEFGKIILLIRSGLGILVKKVTVGENAIVAVYPSFSQIRKYELLARTAETTEYGSKRVRKVGSSTEFEQIKEYVSGDDIRRINWKATARRSGLMVNHYTDERSQQVFCIIDKGRLMKMPFENLTLLDYAINSTLVLSSVCLNKQDRIGLMTFSNKFGSMLAADRKPIQMENILQALYRQQTQFLESDFEKLYLQVRTHIKQRSLIVLYTNFESVSGLKRQLPYLKKISSHHLLLVVFFENTELKELSEKPATDIESLYTKTIAEKFGFEKRMIIKELANNGILSILTTPQELTINSVNKYLEIKARQAI